MGGQLEIVTFGSFYISDGVNVNTDAATGKSKIWSLLKYLVAFYGKPVSADQLADAIWSDDDYSDPAKLLRDTIYRLRKALTSCFGDRPFITFDHGNYLWNPEIDCRVDFLEFDKLLENAQDGTKSYDERVTLYKAAIDLYQGPFMRDSTIEIWTMNFTNYYRRLFLQAIDDLADLYEAESRLDEVTALYDNAIASEPYEERLYVRQIQALILNGEYAHARQQYRLFEKTLMREFGAKPSQNLERLSYEIDKAVENQTGDFEQIAQILESGNKKQGAVLCGPETFRQIYVLDKRSDERVNFPIYLVLITYNIIVEMDDYDTEHETKAAMKALRQVLLQSLRRGDVVSQYSKNQFLLMLTVHDNDGGLVAVRRIKYLFESKYGKDKGILDCDLSPISKEHLDTL